MVALVKCLRTRVRVGTLAPALTGLGRRRRGRRVRVRRMFDEQIGWAVDARADFIIAETFSYAAEAELATVAIKKAGLPAVITLAIHRSDLTREGLPLAEAAKRLEAAGADVVGFNCIRGPWTMLPLLTAARAAVKCHVAA